MKTQALEALRLDPLSLLVSTSPKVLKSVDPQPGQILDHANRSTLDQVRVKEAWTPII